MNQHALRSFNKMKWILGNCVSTSVVLAALVVLSGCETAPPTVTQPSVATKSVPRAPTVSQPATSSPTPTSTPSSQNTVVAVAQEPQQQPQPVVASVSRSPSELALAEGVDIFNQGNYPGAIKRLQEAKKIASDSVYIQQDADKYTAFAYCLLNRRPLCRQHFVMLLAKDSSYELSSAEANHPMWGATFKEAKASMIKKPPVKK
jgi:hypothetical protein